MPRSPTPEPPFATHTRDWYVRLNELRRSHPHLPVQELQHFLNHPVADEPAKPAPPKPTPRTQAQRIWPYLK
jgi:hypothetical protein